MRELNVFFIAGENSGDIHGSNLLRAMKRYHPAVNAVGLGGPDLQRAGMNLRYNMLEKLAITGTAGVIRNFGLIRRTFLLKHKVT